MKSSRYESLSAVSANRYNTKNIRGETIWIDSDNSGKWLVLKNQDAFTESEIQPPYQLNPNQKFGYDVKVSANGQWMFVSAIEASSGTVTVYNRPSNVSSWRRIQTLTLPTTYINTESYTEKFGKSIDVTDDGSTLVIGSPDVSDFRSDIVDGINVGNQGADPSGITKQGIVVVYVYNVHNSKYDLDIIISSYDRMPNEGFGSKVKITNDGTDLWLFVSSESYDSDKGRVQIFRRTKIFKKIFDMKIKKYVEKLVDVWVSNEQRYLNPGVTLNSGDKYGYDLDCTYGGNLIAVSAPYRGAGEVYVFVKTSLYTFHKIETFDSITMEDGSIPSTVPGNTYLRDTDGVGYSIAINNDLLFVNNSHLSYVCF
jgi:hypothetical protein